MESKEDRIGRTDSKETFNEREAFRTLMAMVFATMAVAGVSSRGCCANAAKLDDVDTKSSAEGFADDATTKRPWMSVLRMPC